MKLWGSVHLLISVAIVEGFYESCWDKMYNTYLKVYTEVTTSLVECTSSFMFQETNVSYFYAVSCLELPKVPF